VTDTELFRELAELIPAAIEREYPASEEGCCILATRIAIEVASYYGITVEPVSCVTFLCNAAFHQRRERGELIKGPWPMEDGSYSVSIGFEARPGRWNGHLIALAPNCFGDFSIGCAERREHNIITGAALLGTRPPSSEWEVTCPNGTVVTYRRTEDLSYRAGPDWKEPGRRKRISGPIIRELQKRQKSPLALKTVCL
jgi:hypothetical protein